MKDKLLEAVIRLIDVKSIISFAVVGVFVYLAVTGKIEPENAMYIVSTVIAFFFGTKVGKKEIK